MTRVISMLNFKGGTGKTTTVVNLGAGLALHGHRVLSIDLDPQGGIAVCLGVSQQKTLADILLGEAHWSDVVAQARPRFDVIPADRRLADAERLLTARGEEPTILGQRLAGILQAGYDYVLLDCAPSIDLLTECALRFSQEVFIPVSMDYLALVGMRMVIIEVLRARRLFAGMSAQIALIIPCFYDNRFEKSEETIRTLTDSFTGMLADPIHLSEALAQAPRRQMTIFEYDPHGAGSLDYARLVERVAGLTNPKATYSVGGC